LIANASNSLEFSLRKILSPAFSLEASAIVEPGITVLFGASGSGKTALLKCVAGLLQPDQGRIAIGGQALFDSQAGANENVTSRRIGLVFQNLALFPHLNAEANIAYGMSGLSAAARAARAHAIASAFRIEHALGRRPAQLSGGEQQRVALARAIVTDPLMILADEPTGALDTTNAAHVLEIFQSLQAPDRAVVMVTHDLGVAATARRKISMRDGQIVADEYLTSVP
jgi:ABC-type lipoprotein export system ATPase subunit